MSINNRLFGAPLRPEVKKKLEDRQRVAGQAAPGESIEAVFPDAEGNVQSDLSSRTPFVRMWTSIKIIDPAEIVDLLEQISKEEYEDARFIQNFQSLPGAGAYAGQMASGNTRDKFSNENAIGRKLNKYATEYPNVALREVVLNQQDESEVAYCIVKGEESALAREQVEFARQTYIVGDYNYQKQYGEVEPNEENKHYNFKSPDYRMGGLPPSQGGATIAEEETFQEGEAEAKTLAETIFKTQLEINPLLRPQAGITRVTTETQGSLGVIKKTTIDFKVNNSYDYDRIFNKFFLKPGATVFVDFGWSSVKSLYEPEDLITHHEGIIDFLYAEGDETSDNTSPGVASAHKGIITRNQGDLEVLKGIVSDYSAKANTDGSWDCSLTLTSANSALLSFSTDDKVVARIINTLERGLLFLGVQAILREQAEDRGNDAEYRAITNDLQQLLNTPDVNTDANDIDSYNTNLQRLGVKLLSATNGKPNGNSIRTGVFVEQFDYDNTFMSFGLFEDLIINAQFGFGKTYNDINKGKNSEVRIDSTNSFTNWNKKYSNSQQVILNSNESSPTFLYPEWWGNGDPKREEGGGSYNFQQGKWPKQDDYYTEKLGDGDMNLMVERVNTFDRPTAPWDKLANRIPLREIFINTDTIIEAFRQNDNVQKVLNQILDEINKYSSNIMKLTMIRGDSEDEIKIVDKNYSEFDEKEKLIQTELDLDNTFTFNIMSPNSIVKDYNLEFKLPSGMIGNMYAIQAMGHTDRIFSIDDSINDAKNINKLDDNALSIIYEPDLGTHRLKQYLEFNNDSAGFNVYHAVNNLFENDIYSVSTIAKPNLRGYIDGVNEDAMFDSDTVEAPGTVEKKQAEKKVKEDELITLNDNNLKALGIRVAQSLKEYYGIQVVDEVVRYIPQLLPYTLSLTTYGISTVNPGETFKVDYLPKAYLDKTYLQITKVKHNLNPDGWYTTFETQFRLREYVQKTQEEPQEVRLTSNILNNLGIKDQLTVSEDAFLWLVKDSYLPIKQIAAYMTDIVVYQPTDYHWSFEEESGIDFILDFTTTNKVSEAIVSEEKHGFVQNLTPAASTTSGPSLYGVPLPAEVAGGGEYSNGTIARLQFEDYQMAAPLIDQYGLPSNDITGKTKDSQNRLFERRFGIRNGKGMEQFATGTGDEYFRLEIAPKNVKWLPNKRYQIWVSGPGMFIIDRDMFKSATEEIQYLKFWNRFAGKLLLTTIEDYDAAMGIEEEDDTWWNPFD